jgi:hypothetical protein
MKTYTPTQVTSFINKSSRVPYAIIPLLLVFILFYHSVSMDKIHEQDLLIDSLIEAIDGLTSPFPQGNGGIESPGVLPPKGWVDPRTIISTEITYTF